MSGTVLTNKGLALITKLVAASTELQISRVAVGTGRVPSGVDPQTMVDLNEYKMDAQIESYGVSPDQSDVAYIAAQVSSIGVSAGFAVTEAGVFATDPDVGEILYAYLDLTEDPQYIYAETDAISKFAEITFNVLIGSVAKVTAYVSPGALTKKVDFNAFKESVETPEFDDSGAVEGISSFPSFLETMKSKMNFFQFFRNLKAGLQFVLHAGQIVNNCVTDNAGLPLSAAQGKALKDLYTQLYSEKVTWCGNITDLSTLVSLSQQNKTVYIGYIDWRQTDILPSGSKSGTTICFASNWWIWALSGSKEFFCLTQEAKWEKAPYLLSNDLTDFQNKFFINMTNYTFDDLKKVYTGVLPKIGFVGYSGPFTPNRQTGYVLCGGSCALLFSVNGDRYRYNTGNGDTAWVKLT